MCAISTGIYLNSAELQALHERESELFHLYVAGLRKHMNLATGIVDCCSYYSLAEDIRSAGRPGVAAKSYSKEQIRRMLAQLIDIGLLKKCGSSQQLAFACLLADRSNESPPEFGSCKA
ncbi:hypothetical protein ACKI2N_001900 [Cupriavidus sp. 30B13]|uniref:hypothetical protein n=1 Tax=Cupriavidus sp. 30B13 TaxID=3384241 RepID=UPI003B8F80A2